MRSTLRRPPLPAASPARSPMDFTESPKVEAVRAIARKFLAEELFPL
jgi:hypothetical protein